LDLVARIALYTFIGIFVIVTVVTSFSIEFRTNRAVNKIMKYLNKKNDSKSKSTYDRKH